MKIHVSQLPCDEASFVAKLDAYKAARAAHARTVGVPAPFPEYEIFRVIVERGGEVTIERDALQEQAQQSGRDALAELDALKAELLALKSSVSTLEAVNKPLL